jgi:probable F420-dependent oxidoreductase
VSVWAKPATEVSAAHRRLQSEYPGRFLLGLGVSHAPMVAEYRTPLRVMRAYLDALDRDGAVPARERVLAALAPKMLELARERAAGSHPYLVDEAHTRRARAVLGAGRLLAPELGVVLETDPERARGIARRHLETYTRLPNYVNNWRRSGFGEDDVNGGCSDRLVDALIAWGDLDAIRARIAAHHAAGADHVALQVLTETPQTFPRAAWRQLAAAAV